MISPIFQGNTRGSKLLLHFVTGYIIILNVNYVVQANMYTTFIQASPMLQRREISPRHPSLCLKILQSRISSTSTNVFIWVAKQHQTNSSHALNFLMNQSFTLGRTYVQPSLQDHSVLSNIVKAQKHTICMLNKIGFRTLERVQNLLTVLKFFQHGYLSIIIAKTIKDK